MWRRKTDRRHRYYQVCPLQKFQHSSLRGGSIPFKQDISPSFFAAAFFAAWKHVKSTNVPPKGEKGHTHHRCRMHRPSPRVKLVFVQAAKGKEHLPIVEQLTLGQQKNVSIADESVAHNGLETVAGFLESISQVKSGPDPRFWLVFVSSTVAVIIQQREREIGESRRKGLALAGYGGVYLRPHQPHENIAFTNKHEQATVALRLKLVMTLHATPSTADHPWCRHSRWAPPGQRSSAPGE